MMWPIFRLNDTDFSDPANTRHRPKPYPSGTPASYGFAVFDGRTRADNAPEAMLFFVANAAVPSGLKPSVASICGTATSPTSCQRDSLGSRTHKAIASLVDGDAARDHRSHTGGMKN